jgi:hypothetical protein
MSIKLWSDCSAFPNNNLVLAVSFLLGKGIEVPHAPNKSVWSMVKTYRKRMAQGRGKQHTVQNRRLVEEVQV